MKEEADTAEAPAPGPRTLRALFPSILGPLGIALEGQSVTRLVIAPKGKEKKSFTPFEDLEDTDFLDEIFGRLSEYFAGARRNLELAFDLAPAGLSRFENKVLNEVAKIPYGRTRTYQRIASSVGHPEGYRQVLAVLLVNPIPILIPCHRVVTNKSGVGSYIAGKDKKRRLLTLEKESLEDAV